jgi:hypothetical protein
MRAEASEAPLRRDRYGCLQCHETGYHWVMGAGAKRRLDYDLIYVLLDRGINPTRVSRMVGASQTHVVRLSAERAVRARLGQLEAEQKNIALGGLTPRGDIAGQTVAAAIPA